MISPQSFDDVFRYYSPKKAPFLHQMRAEVLQQKPFKGLRIAHNIPLVNNTLMKIACLVAGGAEVSVTCPSFLQAHDSAIAVLHNESIEYVPTPADFAGRSFDMLLDCNAELGAVLTPTVGAIEVTQGGANRYRAMHPNYPVISVDDSLTKQIETCIGTGEGMARALEMLLPDRINDIQQIGIFGFGKVGKGIAFALKRRQKNVTIFEPNTQSREVAKSLSFKTYNVDKHTVYQHLPSLDCIITATGIENCMSLSFDDEPFRGKILTNVGVTNEWGSKFAAHPLLLNEGWPINFLLDDPTPMEYIDPVMYAHNLSVFALKSTPPGVYALEDSIDTQIVERWKAFHPDLYAGNEILLKKESDIVTT